MITLCRNTKITKQAKLGSFISWLRALAFGFFAYANRKDFLARSIIIVGIFHKDKGLFTIMYEEPSPKSL